MSESIRVEDEVEKLVALQAIETFRAVRQAVKTAPHGKGLETVEAVVRDKGFDQLSKMYQGGRHGTSRGVKKGLCTLSCECGKNASFRRVTPKHLLRHGGGDEPCRVGTTRAVIASGRAVRGTSGRGSVRFK